MRYEIFQIRPEHTRELAFRDLAEIGGHVDLGVYRSVYMGEIAPGDETVALDTLFRQFNVDHPTDFAGRLMSVSDVVSFYGARFYYCNRTGWESLQHDHVKGQVVACTDRKVP